MTGQSPALRLIEIRDTWIGKLQRQGHQPRARKAGRAGAPDACYHLTCSECGGELQVGNRWTSTVRGRPRLSTYGRIWRCRP